MLCFFTGNAAFFRRPENKFSQPLLSKKSKNCFLRNYNENERSGRMWNAHSTRLVADSPWTEAADRTTNCTLGNINGHAVGHDGREADVSSCRKSRVCRPTKRIIFVSRQLARKHVVEYVPVKGNMRFWKTFRVFLPSFDGGRVHSPTQVGQDE